MKSDHQKRIEEFMLLAKQEVPSKPTLPSVEVRRLRAKLILEEAIETIHGLGFELQFDLYNSRNPVDGYGELQLVEFSEGDLEEIVDGCCDISVVTYGTLSACGVPDLPFIEEVDNNNLAKFGPGHTIRVDGKLIKPPDHEPPKIKEILETL